MNKNIELKDIFGDISRIPQVHSEFVLTKDSKKRMRAAIDRHVDASKRQCKELENQITK